MVAQKSSVMLFNMWLKVSRGSHRTKPKLQVLHEYGGLRLPNGKYNARVRAQNKAGLGPPSNEVIIDLGKSILLTLYGVYQG